MGSDAALVRGLGVAVVAALVMSLLARSVRRDRLWLAGVPAAALYYGQSFAGFVVVIVAAYAVCVGLAAVRDPGRRWQWGTIALVGLAVFFTAGRIWHWGDRSVVYVSGLSMSAWTLDMWLALRLVTILWETASSAVVLPSFGSYLGWVTLPFTLPGPLVRFSELPPAMETRRRCWVSVEWWKEVGGAVAKLASGLTLGGAPAYLAAQVPHLLLLKGVAIVFVTAPLAFYLTFAGHYHLNQLLARSAGIPIPDSFNWPFGRQNISTFWANWNMTATRVFRDYLFFNRWGFRRYNAYVNTVVLFVLVGVWHAPNAYWVIWGLLHGLLFCAFLLWRSQRSRLEGWLPLRNGRVAQVLASAVTYVAVCACWYIPSKILQRLGVL